MEPTSLRLMAETNIRDTVMIALGHSSPKRSIMIYDTQSALSKSLTQAYRAVLPEVYALDFDQSDPDGILEAFDTLSPGDLVILIQSTSFRLSKFRIRIELFNRKLKVIEHPHLSRIQQDEHVTYFDALAYDPSYYRTVGPWLKERIAQASRIRIISQGDELVYDSPFEDPKLNIGHYEGMKNIGGQFPIGEVFTEPREIQNVNGTARLFAFGDSDFSVHYPEKPFTAIIKQGILVSSPNAPEAFHAVLDEIRAKEEVVWVRELGFGLNRALTRRRHVTDIGTYERMCGIHLSLGAKHLIYKKPAFPKKQGFHVDVFVEAESVQIDGVTVFENDKYCPT